MISLEEFRDGFINEEINADAQNNARYPIEVFIDCAVDILQNDYSLVNGMEHCYFNFTEGNRAFKSMRVDGAYLDFSSNTLNLLFADYNPGDIKSITNEFITNKSNLLLNYFINTCKGFFNGAEQADPAVQMANDIKVNIDNIGKIHLFIVSTDKLSKVVKCLALPAVNISGREFEVALDVLDIEKIYRSRMAGFEKEELVIRCEEFGIEGIPCLKANIETDQYESYLAIVPGKFLADIYKKYGSELLESNVRSFLKFNGSVNKGIRGTVLNEKSRFFTYNNGISTTARAVEIKKNVNGESLITSFADLQIINGGQTTATLAATSIKNNADLTGIFVQMKLTVLENGDPDLIRNIATYANSQNKVKTADLNSSHPFYVRMEDYSRRIYAPISTGQIVQQLWFFERARGQYEQPQMQMTKKQRDDYKLVRPRSMKFTLTDLAKYENAADMMPHYVSWGGEVNAAHFHNLMVDQWEKNNSVYNELFYKELIGKKILFEHIGNVISDQEWYQLNRAYRPQLIAYTFSKLVQVAKEKGKTINYRYFWDMQSVPASLDGDIARIAKLVFDAIHDPKNPIPHIETYFKKIECWQNISKKAYELSESAEGSLTTEDDHAVEVALAKKEQKRDSDIQNELDIFNKGAEYWESLIYRGKNQGILNHADINALENAINYCNLKYLSLSTKQIKAVQMVTERLKENGIE